MLRVNLMVIQYRPEIRQILLHWCYELLEKDFFFYQLNKLVYKNELLPI